MKIKPLYEFPFSWQNKTPENITSDCQWLELIIRTSAPFSEAWIKARIVQLAYPNPPGSVPSADNIPTYAGLESEREIVQAIRSICDLKQYPCLAETIDEQYVTLTLNSWRSKKFSQAVSRNFEIYADRLHNNVFLITSTASISLHVERQLPPLVRYRPLFNIQEFAQIIKQKSCQRLTLRTHGYANNSRNFYKAFMAEADALNRTNNPSQENTDTDVTSLDEKHFYVGYHWPSEQPIISPGLWVDFRYHANIVSKFLFVIALFSLAFGTILYLLLKLFVIPLLVSLGTFSSVAELGKAINFSNTVDIAVSLYWIIPAIFVLWAIFMQILRVVAYQRDRYRALHYGAPDLGEFFWRLDKALTTQEKRNQTKEKISNIEEPLPPPPKKSRIIVNLIGHSMGGLLLVNVLRLLADRFGKDDRGSLEPDFITITTEEGQELRARPENEDDSDSIGEHLLLDKLILASPDIPLEFLREGRNNYVRSAMRRCRQIYLFSSDRDIVLRYLATLGNWFSEPSIEMSGYRLGNVFLQRTSPKDPTSSYRLLIRNMFHPRSAVKATSAYDLFQKFNYIDCSEMQGVNGVNLPLNPITALPIDILNAVFYAFKIDPHGGYFFTFTPSFAIIKLLITLEDASDTNINLQINTLIEKTKLRFLASQPFMTPPPPLSQTLNVSKET
ncbi:alpha/beta hydrolase [Ancylothrix sp. C2]|uniref:alpha/beta hydrolase n=1 Tax=Ancylothrix sp. D3o TaxID=2953691 RepID=UPI0021BB78CE|nr:alpha/beta hydrolase [Ancylothrix sp. D3o]MCT7952327.1 alpha/beta hydrolase [Ancylothrix sp. D3o]